MQDAIKGSVVMLEASVVMPHTNVVILSVRTAMLQAVSVVDVTLYLRIIKVGGRVQVFIRSNLGWKATSSPMWSSISQ